MALDPNTGMYEDQGSPFPDGMFGGALKTNNAFLAQSSADEANTQRMLMQHHLQLSNQESEQQLKKQQFEQGLREQYVAAQSQLGAPQNGMIGPPDLNDIEQQSALNAQKFAQPGGYQYASNLGRLAATNRGLDLKEAELPSKIALRQAHQANFAARTASTEALTPSRVANLKARTLADNATTALKQSHKLLTDYEYLQEKEGVDPSTLKLVIDRQKLMLGVAQKNLASLRDAESKEFDPKKREAIHADLEKATRAYSDQVAQVNQYVIPHAEVPGTVTTNVAPKGASLDTGTPAIPSIFTGKQSSPQGSAQPGQNRLGLQLP